MSTQPWTADQRKAICAWLRQRGLWEERHNICGIHSLRALTKDQAARLIDRHNIRDQRPNRPRPRPRLTTDATDAQRRKIASLLHQLGWHHGPHSLRHGIRGRHKIEHLYTSHIDRRAANDLINELQRAVAHSAADGSAAGNTCGTGLQPVDGGGVPF